MSVMNVLSKVVKSPRPHVQFTVTATETGSYAIESIINFADVDSSVTRDVTKTYEQLSAFHHEISLFFTQIKLAPLPRPKFIPTQNGGFVVDSKRLAHDLEAWFTHLVENQFGIIVTTMFSGFIFDGVDTLRLSDRIFGGTICWTENDQLGCYNYEANFFDFTKDSTSMKQHPIDVVPSSNEFVEAFARVYQITETRQDSNVKSCLNAPPGMYGSSEEDNAAPQSSADNNAAPSN